MKKGGVITFHKSQNSEFMQDHEIAIHDGNLKLISENYSQASNKAMNRERELIPQSQLFISNCLSWTNSLWLAQAAWKEKFGLSYELSLSGQCFTAGCGNNESPNFSPDYTTTTSHPHLVQVYEIYFFHHEYLCFSLPARMDQDFMRQLRSACRERNL